MDTESSTDKKVIATGKFVLTVFLAGSGLVLWLLTAIFNPQNEIRQNLALIQQDTSTIKESIKDFNSRVAEMEKEQRSLSERMVRIEASAAVPKASYKDVQQTVQSGN